MESPSPSLFFFLCICIHPRCIVFPPAVGLSRALVDMESPSPSLVVFCAYVYSHVVLCFHPPRVYLGFELDFRKTMEQSYRSNMRSLSVDFTHGGRPNGFDAASTDLRTWLQQWPRVLSQLDTLVVGLKRRCEIFVVVGSVVVVVVVGVIVACNVERSLAYVLLRPAPLII